MNATPTRHVDAQTTLAALVASRSLAHILNRYAPTDEAPRSSMVRKADSKELRLIAAAILDMARAL